jgi:hypothetical protein
LRATSASADQFDYIARFYDPGRRHSSIGNISPMECELRFASRANRPKSGGAAMIFNRGFSALRSDLGWQALVRERRCYSLTGCLVVMLLALGGCKSTSEQPSRDATGPEPGSGIFFVCSDEPSVSQSNTTSPACIPRTQLPQNARVFDASRRPWREGVPSIEPASNGEFRGGLIVGAPVNPRMPGASPAIDPVVGSSRHGLEEQLNCSAPHYLLGTMFDGSAGYNPFTWWEESGARQPPPTGALRDLFTCEFSTYLSRVVGTSAAYADPRPLSELGFVLQDWEDRVDTTPFAQPAGTSVRYLRPASQPVLRSVSHSGRNIVALVNEAGAGALEPDPGAPRPSLWLDFDFPQRAVGLEFGVLAGSQTSSIRASGVKLMAYDEQGVFVVGSDGDGCILDANGATVGASCLPADGNRNVDLGSLANRIGVRDQGGRIASVELRFGFTRTDDLGNTDLRIDQPQVVSRIWREALPPAAILQGLVGKEGTRTGSRPLSPFAERYNVNSGPRSFALPYRFDRAAVFLRGFRLEASGEPAQAVNRILFGVLQNAFEFAPGQSEMLSITPMGAVLRTLSDASTLFDIVSYFTVVAWDSRQVELGVVPGMSPLETDANAADSSNAQEPHTRTTRIFGLPAGERLFAGLQLLQLDLSKSDEIESLLLWPGYQRGLGWAQIDAPSLRNFAGAAMWRMHSSLESDDNVPHTVHARIVALSGNANTLALGADPPARFVDDPETALASANWIANPPFITNTMGPRLPLRSTTHDAAFVRDPLRLAWPLRATVPFLSMGLTHARPGGHLGEIDVEHRGLFYNGRLVDWSSGYGISDDPRTSSSDSTRRGLRSFPTFGAINPSPPRLGGHVRASPLHVHNATIGCENRFLQPHEPHGLIENEDRAPLRIVSASRDASPSATMFDYEFEWRGQRFNLDGLAARAPLQLRTGEQLKVRVIYTPNGPAGVPNTALLPHSGDLIFASDSPFVPTFKLDISGSTDGVRPAARWSVSRVQLGGIGSGATRRQTVQLVSTGDARLCVTRAYFNAAPPGFQVYGMSNALEPDILSIEVGCTHSGRPNDCQGRNDLIVESNAGTLTLPVTANVQEPPIVVPPCETPEDYFRGCSSE